MAKKGDPFDFDAPKYVDFTQDDSNEAEDSYFEAPDITPRPKKQVKESSGAAKTTEKVDEAALQSTTSTEEIGQSATVTKETKQPHTPTEETGESATVTGEPHPPTKETELPQPVTEQLQEPPTAVATEQEEVKQPSTEHTEDAEEVKQPLTEHSPTEEAKQSPSTDVEEIKQQPTEETEHMEEEALTEQPPTEHIEEQPLTEHMEDTEEAEHIEDPASAVPEHLQSASKGKRRARGRSSSVGVRHSPRLFAISKALRRINAARHPLGEGPAATRTQENQVKKVSARPRAVRRLSGASGFTQEDEEELEAVATFRQKITHNKKRKDAPPHNQPLKPTKPHEFHFATDQRLRKNQVEDPAPPPPQPVHRTRLGPTKPQEFSFATDARLKGKDHVREDKVEPPVDLPKLLRSSTTSLNKEPTGRLTTTIPQPFNLSESRKPQGEEPKKFVSMAELNCKYYIQTPERFRTKRAGSTEEFDDKKKLRGPTMPHTPNFATSRRLRSNSVKTHEEREQQAFEEAQKHTFKAKPVNKKVLQTPPSGYRVEKKLLTVPEPFNITDSKKIQIPLIPESMTDCAANVSMSSLPYGGLPLQGKRLTTKLQPFSFDTRDKEKLEKKQEKIKKVLEDEKRLAEFNAHPMPVFEDGVHGVPTKKPATPTQFKPFNLYVEQRGSLKEEKFKQQLEEEAQAEADKRKFHAQSDQVVHKQPFIPEKSNKPLTEISNISLNTEKRASERADYDQQQKSLEEEMLAAKKMEEERRVAEELAEVARLRQAVVHKAQPVPKIKPMVIQPAPHPPTVPMSPHFATESRLRSRSRANSTFSL